MNSLLQVSLPGSILLTVLNAMVASLLACGVALLLCRRVSWSLPTRHALSVAAIAVSLATPLLVSVLRLPPLWTIEDGDRVTLPAPTVSSPPVVTTSGIDREAHAAANSPSDISPGSSQTIVTQLAEVPSTGVEPPDGSLDRVPEPADPAPVSPVLPAIMSAGTIGTLLCGIWVIGVAICLGRTIVTLRRLRQWTHTLVAAESETLVTTAHAVSIAAGLRCPAPVYCSALLPAPVTFGLLNPRIVVPKEIELELAPDQLRAVFQHEIAHIARRDLWVALMQQCAAIVYWWNPLVRLVNRRIADLREQICDDIAIRDLPDPGRFAETLIRLAERCSPRTAIPATLGIGASPTQQLESRILRILSPLGDRAVGLTRRSLVGVTVAVVLMATTLLMAQVQMKSPAGERPEAQHSAIPEKDPSQHNARDTNRATVAAAAESNPTLTELIRQIAKYEQQSLPFEIQSMETFRFPDDLSLEERARNLRADGRKHQRLMEYAQLAPRIWRTKETHLVDGEKQPGGPWQSFADGEQIVQSSPGSVVI
ncbi:MAG: M56 family metallopeptidase, partial [Planctomycetota bacterium]|nr:M56 family metallopeptidase [Planctomycetota bacterium]